MLPQNVQLIKFKSNTVSVLGVINLIWARLWRGLIWPVVTLLALLKDFLNNWLILKYFP